MKLTLLTVGGIDSNLISKVLARVEQRLSVEAVRVASLPSSFTAHAYDSRRNQYAADKILAHMRKLPEASSGGRVMVLVDLDLYTSGMNFIFGLAESPGRLALVSLRRLFQPSNSANGGLLESRLTKEIVHELGHTLGLTHCSNPQCVMFFSNTLRDTDCKGDSLCDVCQRMIRGDHRND